MIEESDVQTLCCSEENGCRRSLVTTGPRAAGRSDLGDQFRSGLVWMEQKTSNVLFLIVPLSESTFINPKISALFH